MVDPSGEMQKLEELMAELRKKAAGTATAPGVLPPDRKKKKKRGGILDLIAVSMAIYTMVVTTPVGGLIVRTFNWMTGAQAKTRPLIAYFATEGTSTTDGRRIQAIAQAPKKQSATEKLAKKVGLSPEVAQAVLVVASSGEIDAAGHYDVRLLPGGRASMSEIGTPFPSNKKAKERETALIQGVAALEKELRSAEAAVAAIAVELPRVRYAVERARASGTADPVSYEALRAFLPPSDRDDADNLVHGTFALAIAYDLEWPVEDRFPVTSGFGYREHPILGGRRLHAGTDLGVPSGTNVRAIADGVVLHANRDGINGLFVEIDHGHGLTSTYCHNSKLLVSRGDRVKKGGRISRSGSTGRSTGPHLHFQVEIDGRPVDPELFRQGVAPLAVRDPLQRILDHLFTASRTSL
jgi:murein DD-endopeptidase MepM/ murein hydrolase activator NlpD